MPYDGMEGAMSKRELIAREVNHLAEPDLDKLLIFLRSLKDEHMEAAAASTLAAESSLSKDWLTPEEDAAWANL